MREKVTLLDKGAVITFHRSDGIRGLDLIPKIGEKVLVPPQLIAEINDSGDTKLAADFGTWLRKQTKLGNLEVLAITDNVLPPFPVGSDGKPRQRADFAIKYFFETSEFTNKWDARILSEDGGLTKLSSPSRPPYKTSLQFLLKALNDGHITKSEYKHITSAIVESNAFSHISPDYHKSNQGQVLFCAFSCRRITLAVR